MTLGAMGMEIGTKVFTRIRTPAVGHGIYPSLWNINTIMCFIQVNALWVPNSIVAPLVHAKMPCVHGPDA